MSVGDDEHLIHDIISEEQAACSRDVQRHCRPVIDQGDFTILACLQQHRPKLTAACRLPESASFVPAISSAVPWSTDVRMKGNPNVTFTA